MPLRLHIALSLTLFFATQAANASLVNSVAAQPDTLPVSTAVWTMSDVAPQASKQALCVIGGSLEAQLGTCLGDSPPQDIPPLWVSAPNTAAPSLPKDAAVLNRRILPDNYSAGEFFREIRLVPKKNLGMIAGTLAVGTLNWKWGRSKFHFINEGWFGTNTKALGMDKLGHAHGTASIADGMTLALRRRVPDAKSAALTGSIYAMGIMTFVEIADGTSDYGFSANDLIADTVGATFSYFRNTIPGMREKVDYRFEYIPSPNGAFRPWSDYSGQKYLLAFKLAGWRKFEETPLKYIELHVGYFARGFTTREESRGVPQTRSVFFGVGINVERLLLGRTRARESENTEFLRETLRHVQIPYTYVTGYTEL